MLSLLYCFFFLLLLFFLFVFEFLLPFCCPPNTTRKEKQTESLSNLLSPGVRHWVVYFPGVEGPIILLLAHQRLVQNLFIFHFLQKFRHWQVWFFFFFSSKTQLRIVCDLHVLQNAGWTCWGRGNACSKARFCGSNQVRRKQQQFHSTNNAQNSTLLLHNRCFVPLCCMHIKPGR